jgi:large subunit ribosomal protein L30
MSETANTRPAARRRPRANKAASQKQDTLRLRLAKSGIATPKNHKATIRALGFRRVGGVVECPDTPDMRGQIRKIRHLVEILEPKS